MIFNSVKSQANTKQAPGGGNRAGSLGDMLFNGMP